jgi:5-formyltetrahydrofolate cyclo-ligase
MRAAMKLKRESIGVEQRAQKAEQIMHKALDYLAELKLAPLGDETAAHKTLIGLSVSCGSELSTHLLACALHEKGYQLAYPLCFGEGRMEFARDYHGEVRELLGANPARVCKPAEPEIAGLDLVDAAALSLVFIPVLAFDAEGYRLGMGGGYYDRYMPRLACATPCVGLAYTLQQVNAVPQGSNDIPLHCVLAV